MVGVIGNNMKVNKYLFVVVVISTIVAWFASFFGIIYFVMSDKIELTYTLILFIIMLEIFMEIKINGRWFPIGWYIAIKEAINEEPEPITARWARILDNTEEDLRNQ